VIVGWFLITLSVLPSGDVKSEIIDWHPTAESCISTAFELKSEAELGIGFTCLEDYVEKEKVAI